jgi:hypothetical protein
MANSEAPSEPMGFFVKNRLSTSSGICESMERKLLRFEYVLEGNNKKNWMIFLRRNGTFAT